MKKIAASAYPTRARGGFYLTLASTLLLSACQGIPPKAVVDFAEVKPELAAATNAAPTRQASGSLFHLATYRPAFEDSRARALGDIVTIQIVESLAASQVSKSTVNRNTSASNAITPPLPSMIGVDMKNLEMSVKTDNDFSGKGGTEAANTFSGSISTTVVQVLPNGNLVVAGEKQIGVNQNVDVMRFTGTVNPRMLQPNNVISSLQVANVRVESKGRGAQGEAQTVGWLSRFFLSFNPF
ncbi:flagellar basal body L-ring protein FlgH [Rhodoferax saidenbachensis]|uniref:Flagellar L-ring protein n=1 Tax=Rhodoferax saidenbachensis TaxID=1484693 RepID=A0ABU1ZSN2_9BURK|nr:flagellar basal body L-ring protein FlgH [Rhodoferax saidenbachensis]MDR7308557.1 flagellar L-ring protein precursor FlgH [Rhodoferax saidenbachensis]